MSEINSWEETVLPRMYSPNEFEQATAQAKHTWNIAYQAGLEEGRQEESTQAYHAGLADGVERSRKEMEELREELRVGNALTAKLTDRCRELEAKLKERGIDD